MHPHLLPLLLLLSSPLTDLVSAKGKAATATSSKDAQEPPQDLVPLIEKLVPLRTHTLYGPYVDQDLQNRWWDFGADSIINTNKHIRLTQDRPSQTGWLWSRLPLFPAHKNFQIDVEFMVNGKGHNLFGDGFAVWLTKSRGLVGPVFGSVDNFLGLGIFFDTYANSRHSYSFPRVSAMMGDGQTAYDNDHDGQANEIAACSMDFRRRDIPTKMRLIYIKHIAFQLQLQLDSVDEWDTCFEIDPNLFPEGEELYMGFSALTGDVSDAHDIISIAASTITLVDPVDDPLIPSKNKNKKQKPIKPKQTRTAAAAAANKKASIKSSRDTHSSSSGPGAHGAVGVFLFMLKVIGVLAFCAFAFSAYRTYNAQKKGKRF